jgi:NAD(P)-dependent dehydrogenase (short-subunit alcohol dehydrogenase family)
MKLDDSIAAIVTGGASGLGEAAARALSAEGVKVTIFDLNGDRGAAVSREIGGHFVSVNVADDASVASGVAEAEERHGIARIAVNCAGIAPAAKTVGKGKAPHPLEVFRKVVEINLIGMFNVTSKVAARMVAADLLGEERGVIVNTASVAAFEGQVGQAAYSASKGGVAAMTLAIARDLAEHGIRVMTIAPGLFMTPMLKGLPQNVRDSLGKQAPFPSRLGEPSEYALLVKSIIANSMLNGETISLDGAIRMMPR